MGDNLATHFTASFMAGFVATTMYSRPALLLISDAPQSMYVKLAS